MVDYGEANGVHCCHENEKGIYGDTLERVEKLHKAIPALRCVYLTPQTTFSAAMTRW